MNRRDFLKSTLAAAVQAGKRPPNILVIMTDEHNPRVAGFHGNSLARTPHLDRLAERGVTFEHAYCNSPLCVPSRLSFTAGKYIHRISAWNNSCKLPSDDHPSLPHLLNGVGYESFLCGKQHYDAAHRYGFVEIGGNMNRSNMTGRGGRRAADDESVNAKSCRDRTKDFHPGDDSSILSHDRRVTAGALDFLSRRKRAEKPFFLFLGYLAPHFPLIVPERYWRHFQKRVPMPEIPDGFLDGMPLNYKHLRRGFGLPDMDAATTRRGRELYHGLTEWVDDEIGRVLGALDRSRLTRDTVVIYTADHGENMGEHGLWWKNCMYEQAARVPLIVSWPERWKGGQRRAGACSTVDLVRTLAEIGGTRTPDDWDGTSMTQWLDDSKLPWKDRAVSQYYGHNIASGFAMLRTGDWKYVYHSAPDTSHPAERELYNVKDDPGEFRNLAEEPAHGSRVETMHAALVEELGEHPDESEQRCRAETARGYGG
jgi:choline-sulfatase